MTEDQLAAAEPEAGRSCALVAEIIQERAEVGMSHVTGSTDEDLLAAIEDAQSCMAAWVSAHTEKQGATE